MLEHENDKQELDEEEVESRPGRDLYEWMQALVCSVLVVVLLFTFVVRLIGVDGHSMVPTLQDGDRLLVLNSILYDDYQYGDIVVLRKESFLAEPIVKRVIATGGQTVDIDFDNGYVYVDGQQLDESAYIQNGITRAQYEVEFPQTVPEGHVVVLGDNRIVSKDSRDSEVGMIDQRCIIGKVQMIYQPFSAFGWVA